MYLHLFIKNQICLCIHEITEAVVVSTTPVKIKSVNIAGWSWEELMNPHTLLKNSGQVVSSGEFVFFNGVAPGGLTMPSG